MMKSRLTIFFLIGCVGFQRSQAQHQQPNVVFIIADDMNQYGPLMQYPVKTPALDKLKNESILFINGVCSVPVCNPSRASFLSGMNSNSNGCYLNGADGWNKANCVLNTTESLPECFMRNGYENWGAGKTFHSPLSLEREIAMWGKKSYQGGFGPFPEKGASYYGERFEAIEPWEGPDSDFPDIVNADTAIQFIQQKHNKPFFVCYGLWRPHSPYTAPKRFFDMYKESDMPIPAGMKAGDLDDTQPLGRLLVDSLKKFSHNGALDTAILKKYLWAYAANTSFADWNIGRVIDAVDKSEYADNTIIIFISDNGYHAGEKLRWGKATLWEAADNVPFMVRMPDKKAAISKATVSTVDIYPTLVDFCHLSAPTHKLDGMSMVPVLKNPHAKWERPGLSIYGIRYTSIRDEQYRYIRYPDGSEELYDEINDPHEFINISAHPALMQIKKKLASYIPATWATSVGGRLEVSRSMLQTKEK